jgi:hypothetical protein
VHGFAGIVQRRAEAHHEHLQHAQIGALVGDHGSPCVAARVGAPPGRGGASSPARM